jgi:F0F1-type ATP synthase assembly protein I
MSLSQPQQPNTKTNFSRALVLGSELGFLIALPLTICLVIGILIDKKLNTFPKILILAIIVGIGLTVINVYKLVLPFLDKKMSNACDNNKNNLSSKK